MFFDKIMEDETTFEYALKAVLMVVVFGMTYLTKVIFGHKKKNNKQGQFIVKKDAQYAAEKQKPADIFKMPQNKTNVGIGYESNLTPKPYTPDDCPWEGKGKGKSKKNSREDKYD